LLTAFLSLERDTIAAKGANGNATVETYGGLHFAFNNAGILPATALLANVDEAAFDQVVAIATQDRHESSRFSSVQNSAAN